METSYNTWLNNCLAELISINTLANEQFGIGAYERWDMSQDTGLFVFSNAGKAEVTADAEIIGSFSFVSDTWLWGWANKTVLPHLTQRLSQVRDYGEEHELADLVEPQWHGNEQDAWAMAAVTLKLVGAQAVYRGPSEHGLTFMLLRNLRHAPMDYVANSS